MDNNTQMNKPPYTVMLTRQRPLVEAELDYLPYPVYVQPKLDGIRAHYWNGDLWSRDNKKFNRNVVSRILAELAGSPQDMIVDGELWGGGYSRQQINSAIGVKRIDYTAESLGICFYVFDLIKPNMPFQDRTLALADTHWNISTQLVRTKAELISTYEGFLERKMEGAIIRTANNFYTSGRSSTVWKMKPVKKMIVSVALVNKGRRHTKYQHVCGSLTCVMETGGESFNIGSGLTDKERHLWLNYPPNTIEIEYDSLSDDGIPLQPRIVRVVS